MGARARPVRLDDGDLLTLDRLLDEQDIRPLLKTQTGRIHIYKTLESTNITAKALAADGAAHGDAVIAHTQTAGRGRLGRAFASPRGGLYMSVIAEPRVMGLSSATWITAAAAVAVCRAVENVAGTLGLTDVKPRVKWVNDVFTDGKKVCGILTEAVGGERCVVGIGVNVSSAPQGLDGVAGAVFQGAGDGVHARLAAELLNLLTPRGAWADARALREEYKARMFILGQTVTVTMPDRTFQAVAEDVDEEGRLIVQKPCGAREALRYGEVSVKV